MEIHGDVLIVHFAENLQRLAKAESLSPFLVSNVSKKVIIEVNIVLIKPCCITERPKVPLISFIQKAGKLFYLELKLKGK